MVLKSSRKSSAMWKQIFSDFLSFLGPFGRSNLLFGEPKSAPNPIWEPFWEPTWSQSGPKLNLKGVQDGAKKENRWKQRLLAAQGPPRTPILWLWRRRWGPTWSPKSAKIGSKIHSKIDHFFDQFFKRLWSPKLSFHHWCHKVWCNKIIWTTFDNI